MSEPDVTADDVQRFLKEVAKREMCPSCGTEEEPVLTEESIILAYKPLDLHAGMEEQNVNNMFRLNTRKRNVEVVDVAARFFRNMDNDNENFFIRFIFVICPICGKIEQFALNRIEAWVKESSDGA